MRTIMTDYPYLSYTMGFMVGNMPIPDPSGFSGKESDLDTMGERDANSEQNALLRQQNELLRSLLEKSGEIRVEPSAAWGKFNQKSNEMWGMVTGR